MAISYTVELELAGENNGWTDVSRDLMEGVEASWGLPGSGVLDRVARTGTFKFRLDNSVYNSAGLIGYYSPNHANVRTGFKNGIRCRWTVTAGAFSRVRHIGTIDEIAPVPGLYSGRMLVEITSLDYMDALARAKVTGLDVQVDQVSSDLFSLLIASMTRQPNALSVQTGLDTYPIALDNVQDEKSSMLSVIQDLTVSELGYCFDSGGTLTWQNRAYRPSIITNVDTFLDTTVAELQASRSRRQAINKIQVTSHPRGTDAAATSVLYELKSVMSLEGGETVTILGPYRDPANPEKRVGGTDMVDPVNPTDFAMNAAADGSGADLSASLDITPDFGGNGVRLTLTNTGTQTGYLGGSTAATRLQVRGRAIYDNAPTIGEHEDSASQVQNGVNSQQVDMPYQSDPRVAVEAAQYLVNLYKDPTTQVQKIGFFIPQSDETTFARIMARSISDRIGIQETVSGLVTTLGHFINAVDVTIDVLFNAFVSWTLAPADNNRYWLLGIVGSSEEDASTRLGFGLVLGHTDVAHGDSHSDSAHSDVAHSDVAHSDIAHSDAGHSDSAHGDTAHSDVSHSDVAHSDSHSDDPFEDAHSDAAHVDTAHGDSAHSDVAFVDAHSDAHLDFNDAFPIPHDDGHNDEHSDVAHSDIAHGDSHGDSAHADTHADEAHEDAHGDVVHSDVTHTDVAHADAAHGDGGHADAGHADVAHTDVSHSDTAHGDAHTDAEHGDVN